MGKAAIEKRLSTYWQLEAGNAVIVPLAVGALAFAEGWELGTASYVSLVPVCILLLIGARYWRGRLHQLRQGSAHPPGIGLLAILQWPALGLTLLAVGLTVAAWITPGIAASQADRWIALIMTLLAVAEYVNYYHRQLQHFEHGPDFKRLMTGRGFRASQMSRDIAKWRTRSL